MIFILCGTFTVGRICCGVFQMWHMCEASQTLGRVENEKKYHDYNANWQPAKFRIMHSLLENVMWKVLLHLTHLQYHQCVHQDMCRYQERYACAEAGTLCHEAASMCIITVYCYIGLRNAFCNMLGFRCATGPVSNFYAAFQSFTCPPSKDAGFATLPSC